MLESMKYVYVYILDGEEVFFYAGDREAADKQYVAKYGSAPAEFVERRRS